MEALLRKFLEDTESAGLPEGDYLKLCNFLKDAHKHMNKPERPVPAPTILDLDFDIRFAGEITTNLHISKYIKTWSPSGEHWSSTSHLEGTLTKNAFTKKAVEKPFKMEYGFGTVGRFIHSLALGTKTTKIGVSSEFHDMIYYTMDELFQTSLQNAKHELEYHSLSDSDYDVCYEAEYGGAMVVASILASYLNGKTRESV